MSSSLPNENELGFNMTSQIKPMSISSNNSFSSKKKKRIRKWCVCECGLVLKDKNIPRHKRTKKCRDRIKKMRSKCKSKSRKRRKSKSKSRKRRKSKSKSRKSRKSKSKSRKRRKSKSKSRKRRKSKSKRRRKK